MVYNTPMPSPSSQFGGIFTYILIGIVLFAALGFAVSRNHIKTEFVSDEKARLIASELIAQSTSIRDAVSKLRMRGVKRNELSVQNNIMTAPGYTNPDCSVDRCKVFAPTGGGATFPPLIPGATNSAGIYWGYFMNLSIEGIDYADSAGNYNQMFMMLADVNQKVCRQINNILHGVSLDNDLAGYSQIPDSFWNGELIPGAYYMPKYFFLPLTDSKNAFCMPFTGSWASWNDVTSVSTIMLPGGTTRYYFIVTLSPSR